MSLQDFAACLALSEFRQKCPESMPGPASKLQKPLMPSGAYSMLICQNPWCHHSNHITNKFSSHITFLVESKQSWFLDVDMADRLFLYVFFFFFYS